MVAVALQNPHVLPGSSSRRLRRLKAMTSKIDDVHPKSNRCFILISSVSLPAQPVDLTSSPSKAR